MPIDSRETIYSSEFHKNAIKINSNFFKMGVSGVTLIRFAALVLFLYTWKFRTNIQKDILDIEIREHLDQYGSHYRYLTVLSYMMTILVNFLLVVGDFIPRGKKNNFYIKL